MKIVFMGATELGAKCCRLILEKQLAEVSGILTIPQSFNISYSKKPVKNVLHADFHAIGEQYNIPVVEVEGKMGSFAEQIKAMEPDLILVIGWYYMIPASVRDLAPLGCTGIHASLLPRYRGGAPLVWAMINGEKETGLTLFHMTDGVDDGDVVGQKKFAIEESDTIRELLQKTETASLELLEEVIPQFANGTAPRIPQDQSKATHFPQRKPEDGLIDWAKSPQEIKNFIRAQTKPYPGAFTFINGKKVMLWDADVIDDQP